MTENGACVDYEVPPAGNLPTIPAYWLPKEFAAIMRLHEKSIYRLMKDDPTFPYLRIGGSVRIPRDLAVRWLAARTKGTPAP